MIEGTFVAQINVELQVGAVEETLTVTAETPTVDVINTQKEFVANRERPRRDSYEHGATPRRGRC